jgi:hypothetical protein
MSPLFSFISTSFLFINMWSFEFVVISESISSNALSKWHRMHARRFVTTKRVRAVVVRVARVVLAEVAEIVFVAQLTNHFQIESLKKIRIRERKTL